MMTTKEFEIFLMKDYLYDRYIEDEEFIEAMNGDCEKQYELGLKNKIGIEGYEDVTLEELFAMSEKDLDYVYRTIANKYEKFLEEK